MAYYVVVKYIKQYGIQYQQLSDEVFDYIFLGVGDLTEIAIHTGINAKVLEEMRNEFKYFYPLDSRHSGRDLVPNHLTFMVFVHVGIFPEECWPRQIVVNGSVLMERQKMSKSLGNIIPLRDAVKMFGADPLRMAELTTAELLQDADFSPTLAKSMGDRLERLYKFAFEVAEMEKNNVASSLLRIDKWIISRLQEHVKTATESMDKLMVRKGVHSILYMLDQDFQWYLRRVSKEKGFPKRREGVTHVFREVLDRQVRMLAPIAPHICEEIWEKIGGTGFVSLASWPMYEESKVNVEAEEAENLIQRVFEDTLKIIEAIKMTPTRIHYYVSSTWKWQVYLALLERTTLTKTDFREIMKRLMAEPELRGIREGVVKFMHQIVDEVKRMPENKKNRHDHLGIFNEYQVLEQASEFFEKEFKAKVRIYMENDQKRYDPKKKAETSKPYRPAIYME
jgi:leucyl-tRNA synthetase